MLVNIENMLINTQNITIAKRSNNGGTLIHFIGENPKYIELSMRLNDFIKKVEGLGVITHG